MTFYCKNLDMNTDQCRKLHGDCIMGRPGCVLEGRVALSEELEKKIAKLEAERLERIAQKKSS
jgi:hypothetical protein